MSDLIYQPSEWQKVFHAIDFEELLGAGAAGPGKTLCLLMDPLAQIQTEHARCELPKGHPNHLEWGSSTGWALHLRRMRTMLDQSIMRTHKLFKAIDPGVSWNEQRATYTFTSGFHFQFGHCKESTDWEQFMSLELTHLAFDELTQFEEEQYMQIKTRVRSSDKVLRKMLKTRAMSNPLMRRSKSEDFSVSDPNWVRRYFVDPAPDGKVVLKKLITLNSGEKIFRRRMYLPATLYDNPDKGFVRQYEEQLQDAPAHIRAALLYGNWYVTPGAFFGDEWRPELHTCEPFRIPSDWPQFRSMDWGFKKEGVVHWWAIDPANGTLYCTREFTFKLMPADEVAIRVREYEKSVGLWSGRASKLTGPADTQLWEQRGEVGRSKAEEFAAKGISWTKADKKSRQRNAERLLERLKDHGGGTMVPGIVFFKSCKQAIRTIPSIGPDPNNSEVPLDGGPDHWLDSALYACAYASREKSAPIADKDENDDYMPAEQTSKGRSIGYGVNY